MNCYTCEETTGHKVEMDEHVEFDDGFGGPLIYYVCPVCGDVCDY